MNFTRRLFLTAAASCIAVGFATTPGSAQETRKAAIVMPGSISDKGWNEAGYDGLTKAGEALGFQTAVSEKVHQPDQIEVLSDYARRGYDLVIGHGGEFQDAVERVAERFPTPCSSSTTVLGQVRMWPMPISTFPNSAT